MEITTVLLDGGGVIIDETEQEKIRSEIIAEILSDVAPGYPVGQYYEDVEEAVKSFCPNVYDYVIWKNSRKDLDLFRKLFDRHVALWEKQRPPLKLSTGFDIEAKAMSSRYKLVNAGQYGSEILDLLSRHFLLDCFAGHLTQDDFQITKPDPRYFEQIAARIGASPDECVMVGDRIDKDIIPAKQLGMKTILIRTGLHRNQQPRTPSEFPDVELPSAVGLSAAVDLISGR